MRDKIPTQLFSGTGRPTTGTTSGSLTNLVEKSDFVAAAIFTAILLVSLWLTVQFPVEQPTATFIALFG